MLCNPKWSTIESLVSIQKLIAWLETKNPRRKYPFRNCGGKCLYSQYLIDHGVDWEVKSEPNPGFDIWVKLHESDSIFRHIAEVRPWTFGSALKRAREYQSH